MRHADGGIQLSTNAGAGSQGGSPGGVIVRLEHISGHGIRGQTGDGGSSRDDGLRACVRDSSGLFLVLNLASASGTAPDRAARPSTSCSAVTGREGTGDRSDDQSRRLAYA
jgi:hypothetical protein